MPDTLMAYGDIRDTLPHVNVLLAKRGEIVKRLAPLRAKYAGSGWMGERLFKIEEAKIDIAVRAELKTSGDKVTEPLVEAKVRSNETYIEEVTKEIARRAEWATLEEELAAVDWELRMRQADANLLAAEARLAPMGT